MKNAIQVLLLTSLLMLLFSFSFAQTTLRIEGLDDIYTIHALFGNKITENIDGQIVVFTDNPEACNTINTDLTGKIVLIARGTCSFTTKAANVAASGAIAVIIGNNNPQQPNTLPLLQSDDTQLISIPVLGVTFNDYQKVIASLDPNSTINASLLTPYHNLCATAKAITVGTHQVDSIYVDPVLRNLGGAPSQTDATAAVWFTFTPQENGLMTINSCKGGADTRLWVHTGTCDITQLQLTTLADNDDFCSFEEGNDEDLYASYLELLVEKGITYFLEWDDTWDNNGFTFKVDFTAIPTLAGATCEQAIPIDTGTFVVNKISAFGQTESNHLNGSQWFSIQPNQSGWLSVTSCNGGSDTRLLVHEGTCNQLDFLIGGDEFDNICPAFIGDTAYLASAIDSVWVEQGKTYFLEWSGKNATNSFSFAVHLDTLETLTANVTFQVEIPDTAAILEVELQYQINDEIVIVPMYGSEIQNIWQITLPFKGTDTISYAFLLNNQIEEIPNECRLLNVPFRLFLLEHAKDTLLNAVCFSSCEKCEREEAALTEIKVRFQVDMTPIVKQDYLSEEGVFLKASFNQFELLPMMRQGETAIFKIEVPLIQGETINYLFSNGLEGNEILDATLHNMNCSIIDEKRWLLVDSSAMLLPAFCFETCEDCNVVFSYSTTAFSQYLRVYPNPVNDYFTIDYETTHTTATSIQLVDMLGRIVLEKTSILPTTIYTQHLANGVYWLQCLVDGSIITHLIVVK